MGEVTLPCFLISLPKAIFVIARLVGPFSEKNCDRDLENAVRALRPRAAFSTLISQFFAIRTDLEPFLSALTLNIPQEYYFFGQKLVMLTKTVVE